MSGGKVDELLVAYEWRFFGCNLIAWGMGHVHAKAWVRSIGGESKIIAAGIFVKASAEMNVQICPSDCTGGAQHWDG